jgi:PAS domain S-box-containing protein
MGGEGVSMGGTPPPRPDDGGASLSEARLAAVLESISDGFYALDAEWRYVIFNRAAEAYFGVSRDLLLGKVMWEVFPQGVGTPFERYCRLAMDQKIVSTFETASRMRSDRFVELRIAPMSDGGICVSLNDITERKRTEAARDLLMREVDHRSRNMLSVVQSIIALTRAGTLVAYKDLVLGRINALARAHSSLAKRHWEGGPLRMVIEEELASLSKDQAHILTGPEITLTPERVQPFSMILHELGTNACKYGALGAEGGQVSVDWALTPEGGVRLVWQERGGPPVRAPIRRGFGSRLIHDLARQLGGEARFHWEAAGLRVEILAPLS